MAIKKRKLKLYVWDGIYCDYSCGGAFAIASSLEDARKQLDKVNSMNDHNNQTPKVFSLTSRRAYGWCGGG